jgi:hypothetical protein
MITIIRKHIKSKFFKYIIWFFMAILAIVFILPNLGERLQGPQWIARVNDIEIDGPSFYRATAKQEYNIRIMREQYGAYADMFMQMLGLNRDPKTLAYEELVREAVVDEVAQSIPLYISDDYVDQKFNDPLFVQQSGLYSTLPLGFFTPQGIDEQALSFYLARMGMSVAQFETVIEQALARYIALELAGIANYTPQYMINDAINSEISKRKYAIVSFALDTIMNEEKKKDITDADLKSFFNAHTKNYWVPEQRTGVVWEFNPSLYGITISDNEVQDFYDKHKVRKYVDAPSKVQVRRILLKFSETEPKELLYQRAQALRAELMQRPDAFANKAKELSEDEESAKNGGLLPFFSKGDHDPVFERKSFVLKNDGDISEVFQTENGIELVQRVDKKPMQFKPLSQVKNEIKQTLLHQAFAKAFSNDMKKIIDSTGIDEVALVPFLKEKKSKEHTIPLSSKDDTKRMQMLFRLKDGEAGFFVENEVGYIVQLKEIKPRYLPQLETIKSVVKDHLIEDRAQKALEQRIKQASAEIRTSSAQVVAEKYAGSLQETNFIKQDSKDALEALNKKGIPTNKMLQLEKKSAVATHLDNDKGYVFYVLDVSEGDKEAFNEHKAEIESRVQNERKGLFVQGFVASLSRNATIETNNSVFTLNEAQAV